VKKLISIGVALALLAMVVLPGAVAAYETPDTYAKVPFAIIQSGIELVGQILDTIGTQLSLPTWLNSALLNPIAEWAGGPLSWTVDMLAWGFSVGGDLMKLIQPLLGTAIPIDLEALMNTIACDLMMCWSDTNCTGNFCPCVSVNKTPCP
jgi:hypothetical protein